MLLKVSARAKKLSSLNPGPSESITDLRAPPANTTKEYWKAKTTLSKVESSKSTTPPKSTGVFAVDVLGTRFKAKQMRNERAFDQSLTFAIVLPRSLDKSLAFLNFLVTFSVFNVFERLLLGFVVVRKFSYQLHCK